MASKSNEAHFALLLGCRECLQNTIRRIALFRIVVVHNFVHLPHIQVICLQASEGLLQHPHGNIFLAAMGADFSHQDCSIAFALERATEAFFAGALVVLPRVVEEVDSMVQGFCDHVVHFRLSCHGTEVVATNAEYGHLKAGLAHGTLRRLELRHRSATLSRRVGYNRITPPLRRVIWPCSGGRGDHGDSTGHGETFQKRTAAFPAFSICLQLWPFTASSEVSRKFAGTAGPCSGWRKPFASLQPAPYRAEIRERCALQDYRT